MVKFGKTEIAKETFYVVKRPIKIWDVNFHNILVSKLVKTKTNSKYLVGYLDKDMRPLVLIIPKMSRYVKTFRVEKMNKLMPFCTDDEKLLKTYKAICTNTENLKNIELNA